MDAAKENGISEAVKKRIIELLELNNDTVGWLTVNNTKINYPILQSKDNDYYLDHSFDKKYNEVQVGRVL